MTVAVVVMSRRRSEYDRYPLHVFAGDDEARCEREAHSFIERHRESGIELWTEKTNVSIFQPFTVLI